MMMIMTTFTTKFLVGNAREKKIRTVHNFSSTIYTEKTIEIKSKYLMMHEEKESSTNISIQGDRHKKIRQSTI